MVITINGTVMYVNPCQIQILITSNVVYHEYRVYDIVHVVLVDKSHHSRPTKCVSLQKCVQHNKQCMNKLHWKQGSKQVLEKNLWIMWLWSLGVARLLRESNSCIFDILNVLKKQEYLTSCGFFGDRWGCLKVRLNVSTIRFEIQDIQVNRQNNFIPYTFMC